MCNVYLHKEITSGCDQLLLVCCDYACTLLHKSELRVDLYSVTIC